MSHRIKWVRLTDVLVTRMDASLILFRCQLCKYSTLLFISSYFIANGLIPMTHLMNNPQKS